MNPNFIKREQLLLAAVRGDGKKTCELWEQFCKKKEEHGLKNPVSDQGYEVRIYQDTHCECYVGALVSSLEGNEPFTALRLPPSAYAVFEVQVAQGYDSQNKLIDKWLTINPQGYQQRTLQGKPYIIMYYDDRFQGNEQGSIVEIWVPILQTANGQTHDRNDKTT